MSKYWPVFIIFFQLSCGLKITEEVNDNVLLGTWEAYRISCISGTDGVTELERYEISSITLAINLVLDGSNMNYSASGVCSTSSYGNYVTSFNGTGTGIVDFNDVVSGGLTCTEILSDSSANNVGAINIPTTFLDINGKNISWEVTENDSVLILSHYANFKGSSTPSVCNNSCLCNVYFSKK